jgi:mycofactocin system glycosyltransferase
VNRTVGLLPDAFAVRLHDDVEVGPFLVSGQRVVRVADGAQELIEGRTVRVRSRRSALFAERLLDLDLGDPVLDEVQGPGLDDLTVVVPVRDYADGVDRLLGSLGQAVQRIVVDDASSDAQAIADIVRRHGAQLVRLDTNVGPAAARDRGLRDVSTPFVAFVDADVDLPFSVLQRLLQHFVDPGLAAVAPRMISDPHNRSWLGRYEHAFGLLDLGPRPATVRQWSPVAYIPTACMLARVDYLGAAFDTSMRSGEDVDLVWRLDGDGFRVHYAAEVSAEHDVRGSVGAWLARKAFYGDSAAPLARRHASRMAPGVMSPVAATAVVGLVLQRRWSVAVSVTCAAVTANSAWRGTPADLPTRQRAAVLRATFQGMVGQTVGLMLRHWSPATLALSIVSRRARRVAVVVGLVDGLVAYRSSGVDLDPVRFLAARRSEHLAYGLGVWRGALRERSADCLKIHWLPVRVRGSRG